MCCLSTSHCYDILYPYKSSLLFVRNAVCNAKIYPSGFPKHPAYDVVACRKQNHHLQHLLNATTTTTNYHPPTDTTTQLVQPMESQHPSDTPTTKPPERPPPEPEPQGVKLDSSSRWSDAALHAMGKASCSSSVAIGCEAELMAFRNSAGGPRSRFIREERRQVPMEEGSLSCQPIVKRPKRGN